MSTAGQQKPADFAAARFHMVESQIRPNKVRDGRVLDVMSEMPREVFVPASMTGIAYIDEDLQVTTGRFLLEPMILARLLEAAAVKPTDHVLDVAPATGYSTAVLAALAKDVVAIESDPVLQKQAASNLASLQIKNADVQFGKLAEGYKNSAPYDVILINGCIDVLPDALVSQLAEGGRMVATIRQMGPTPVVHTGQARLFEKIRGYVSYRPLFDANVKILPEFAAKPKFKF